MEYNQTVLKPYNKKSLYSKNVGLEFYKLVHKVLALIVIAWMNNGIFSYTIPFVPNFVRWGLFFLWFGIALISSKKFAKTFVSQCWPLLIFYFYMLLMSLFVSEFYLDTYIKSFTYLIMVYSIFLYYFDGKYRNFPKVMVVFVLLDCVFLAINTYLKLQENPLLARYLSTGADKMEELLGANLYFGVGNYGYFYGLVSVILLLGYLFFNYPKRKLLTLLCIFGFLTVLIEASFTIAILLAFALLSIIMVIRLTKKYSFVITFLLSALLIFLSQGVLEWVFRQLSTIDGISYSLSVRLHELATFFANDNVSGTDLSIRFERYTMSIDAFVHNILTGITLPYNTGYTSGGHSAWLDLLAHFGLFSIPFFIFLFKAYKHCEKSVPKNFRLFLKIYWLYFIFLGFINTLFFANIFTIWLLFLPITITYFFPQELSESSKRLNR